MAKAKRATWWKMDNQVKMAAALDLFRKLSEPQKISYLSRLRSLALHPKEMPASAERQL